MSALEQLRDLYARRDTAARAWRERTGGKVVGYLCDNVPEELILAAGFLPYRLSGEPGQGQQAMEQYIQPFASPFSARNRGVGFTDAMLEMLLTGRYDFLDYLVVPHTRKTIQAYYRELTLARERYPELAVRLPEMFYLDRAYTPYYAAEVFNRQQVLAFREQVEAWSGQPISPAALADAVAVVEENKQLLRQVQALRAASPPRLSGVDALAVMGTAHWMPRAEHSQILRQLLDEPLPPLAAEGPRVFVGGSPLDHPQLYQLVEERGAVVVAEDHCWGSRCADYPLDPSLEPMEALADRYHRKPACSIEFPIDAVVQRCVGRALAGSVDGAIFCVYQGDGGHIWDTPQEIHALEEQHGVPCLHLTQQPYAIKDGGAVSGQIAAFVGSLRPSETVAR